MAFESSPEPSLNKEQIVNYLMTLQTKGFQVYEDASIYTLILGESTKLKISHLHRRILIGGGKSFILGPSINYLDHNEAVLTDDDKKDKPFFNEEWDRATPLL